MPNGWLMEGLFHVQAKRTWGIRVTLKVMAVDKKLTPQDFRKIGRNWVKMRTKQNWEYLYLLVLFYLWYFLTFPVLAQLLSSQGQFVCFPLGSSGSTWIELGFQSIVPLQECGNYAHHQWTQQLWDDHSVCICSQEGSNSVILPVQTLCSIA